MDPSQSDIAADFLTEADEIVARLGEQLVQLEQAADDGELLNAIFRGFHTIKGGASFLEFAPLVEVCHGVEELFDRLRRGQRRVDAELFDLAQAATDAVAGMLGVLRDGGALPPPEPELLRAIDAALEAPAAGAPAATAMARKDGDTISDDEFEALLDQLQGLAPAPAAESHAPATAASAPAALPTFTAHAARPPCSSGSGTQKPVSADSVRVDTRRLDTIMNLVGELVLARNRLKNLRPRYRDEQLDRAIGTLDGVTARLQTQIMRVRMQPIGRVLSRFPKVARDTARQLGKDVQVQLIGEDTELDKNLVEALADPLVHLVRNGIDHGIEAPEVREAAGKPRAGSLTLSAAQQGDHIVIVVADDGAGMDADVLLAKARQKGLIDAAAAARMSAEEAYQLIFAAGFSTKDVATDISGRGVGMDVVKTRLAQLNGSIAIESQRGVGTRFVIRVPLTLAILPALLIAVADRPYAVPLACVHEVFHFRRDDVRYVDGRDVLDARGETLPLVYLRRWLDLPPGDAGECVVTIQAPGGARLGLVTDQVRGREEVVVKALPSAVRGLAGIAGATIVADGSLALILDAAQLRGA